MRARGASIVVGRRRYRGRGKASTGGVRRGVKGRGGRGGLEGRRWKKEGREGVVLRV